MSLLSPILRSVEGGVLSFWCPGCDEAHVINPSIWTWNGSADKPTFAPSVLMKSGHYADPMPPCWCTYNAEHPNDPAPFKCRRCHSFVKEGRIEFLNDCTHALAGQTVPIPPWPTPETP